MTVSPDGRNVYSTSQSNDAVAVFERDRQSGALTQLPDPDGCVSETGSGGQCEDGKALDGAASVIVSPDGRNAYVASLVSDAVAAFERDPRTGALNQLPGMAGCVSQTGSGGQCEDGKALDGAISVTVSPDGRNAYVASFNSAAVAAFARQSGGGDDDGDGDSDDDDGRPTARPGSPTRTAARMRTRAARLRKSPARQTIARPIDSL